MAETTKTENLNNTQEESNNVKDESGKNNGQVKVQLEPDEPKDFVKNLKDLQEKSTNLSRMSEKGIVNEQTGAAIVNREDGQINLSSSKFAQYKLNPNGRSVEYTMESVTVTNRKKIKADEVVINEHKLNPLLYEYTDIKKQKIPTNDNVLIGNFTIFGSVLVKAWEPNLKRYMLIRRPCRMPMFGSVLNVPEIPTAYGIGDPLQLNETILAESDKGYQVNSLIKDAKSLIKDANNDGYFDEGVDRPGINRGDTSDSGGSSSGGNGQGGISGQLGGGVVERKKIWDALIQNGYNEVCTAAIMGNMNQESRFDTHAKNSYGYEGLCQWDPDGRWPKLCSMYSDPYDAGSQINFLVYEANNTRYPDECCQSAMNAKWSSPDQIEDATHDWVRWFEGATGQEEEARKGFAREIYNEFHGSDSKDKDKDKK